MTGTARVFAAMAAAALGISACSPSVTASVARSSLPRETHPRVEATDIGRLVDGNNALALDLYGSLRDQDGNLVFSPYSISAALAMTYAGARGQTESQMASAMHFDLPQAALHPALNELDLALSKTAKAAPAGEQPLQLRIANAVWVERNLSLLQDYLDVIGRNYGAGIQLADFVNRYEAVRGQINAWVSNQTQGKIKDLIPPGALDRLTRMVLVNAIYFKADWADPFDPKDTQTAPFRLLEGSEVETPMMFQHTSAPYASGSGYSAIELPYQGGTAAMEIILPDEGTFEAFERGLNPGRMEEILGNLQPTSVELGLPKFRFTSRFDLGDSLSALGMPDAFNPDLADFSGMTGGRDLFISKVLHQAFVAVDEKGTEAAAATAAIMAPTSAMPSGVTLIADHPFIFLIRDLTTRQILFAGRVIDPTR
jgi:serpin B